MHFALSENSLEECIIPELYNSFLEQVENYFDENKFESVLILEMEGTYAFYYAEKSYVIDSVQKLKSIPSHCRNMIEFNKPIFYTSIKTHPVLGITTQIESKILTMLLIPRKRYFVNGQLSYPLNIKC